MSLTQGLTLLLLCKLLIILAFFGNGRRRLMQANIAFCYLDSCSTVLRNPFLILHLSRHSHILVWRKITSPKLFLFYLVTERWRNTNSIHLYSNIFNLSTFLVLYYCIHHHKTNFMSFLKAIVFYIAPYYLKGRRSAKRPILGPKRLLYFSCMCDCHSLRFRLGRSQHSCIKYHPAKILERHTRFAGRML